MIEFHRKAGNDKIHYPPRKRLLFVISSFFGGGAEMVLVHMINYFFRQGYPIELVVFDDYLEYCRLIPKEVRVHSLHKKSKLEFFRIVRGLRSIIIQYQPDAIISLMFYTNIISVLSSQLIRKNVKLILCEHIFLPMFLKGATFQKLKRFLVTHTYNRADWVVGVSQSIRSSLIRDFKIASEKTLCIYNPIPIDQINQKAAEPIDHPFFLGNDVILVSVGRLVPQKRFDRLLRAFAAVYHKRCDVVLIIIGEGSLREELVHLAESLGIANRVDFVGFKKNPFAWMSKADLFVLTSDVEGLPMVLLEALACGIPVVSTNCCSGPDELIDERINGILTALDHRAVSNSILRLLNDPQTLKRYRDGARKRAAAFDVTNIMVQYEALLDS
jgi:glycosyltransferase involved in cell wall biosynthesis